MKKTMIVLMAMLVAVAFATSPALAAGGKVVSVEGDKVTVSAKGHGLSAGTGGVTLKGDGGSVTGKVSAVAGDKVTIQAVKGKASAFKAGDAVTVDKPKGGEAMQGC